MDLFNNQMVESARQSMTQEQLEDYLKAGKYMYNYSTETDYVPKTVDPMDVIRMVQSGLPIEALSEEELVLYNSIDKKVPPQSST